jgi:hypothetical protein
MSILPVAIRRPVEPRDLALEDNGDALVWGGLYLRSRRVRALISMRVRE